MLDASHSQQIADKCDDVLDYEQNQKYKTLLDGPGMQDEAAEEFYKKMTDDEKTKLIKAITVEGLERKLIVSKLTEKDSLDYYGKKASGGFGEHLVYIGEGQEGQYVTNSEAQILKLTDTLKKS